jgi:sialic acid synthase SpsE
MIIAGKKIGEGHPAFIIAEAGINHNGNIDIAKKMIDAAKNSDVDAIKFQTFKAKDFVSNECEKYIYESKGKKVTESMLKMFERVEFTEEEWKQIANYCKKKKIIFFSTPQNVSDLKMLLKIGVPAIKVGSDDLVNLPLLKEYSKNKLPIIISTGMAYENEIKEAIRTIEKNNKNIALLHCVASYPAEIEELNLRKILTLKEKYHNHIIGYSDHSKGSLAAEISISLGAKIFEKHFTLDNNMEGPDHRFSANPVELKSIVERIRTVEKALGKKDLVPNIKEKTMRKICHRSIIAQKDIKRGEILTMKNISIKRPGTGLPPKYLKKVLGKKAKKDIKKNELIKMEALS